MENTEVLRKGQKSAKRRHVPISLNVLGGAEIVQ